MVWFKSKPPQPPQKLTPPTTKFIGEQDGAAERDLKARFGELLRHEPMVERAYLARAEHRDGTGVHVTLAIKRSCGADPSLIPKLASIFTGIFGSHEHLDMMFVREDQEQQLRSVCRPLYRAAR
jgi:hypothetical protein